MNQNQRYALKEIFRPTGGTVLLTIVIATLWHFWLLVDALRHSVSSELVAVKSFWITNFIAGLPFLETDNTVLKFLTFFVGAYILVWLGSFAFRILDRLQLVVVKGLRRTR